MLTNVVKLELLPDSDEVTKHEAETLQKQVISLLEGAKLSGKSLIIRTEGNRGINQATMIIEVKKSDLDDQFKGFLQNIMISLKTSTDSTVEQKGSIEILRNAVVESKKEVMIEIPGVYSTEIFLKVLSDEEFNKTYHTEEIVDLIKINFLNRHNEHTISKELDYFIPQHGALSYENALKVENSEKDFHQEFILPFLQDQQNERFPNLLLLLGESGSGKTLYLHYLEKRCWENYNRDNKLSPEAQFAWIPIYIDLKLIPLKSGELNLGSFIEKQLAFILNNKEFDISLPELKQLPILFLFDSYDEKRGEDYNIYQYNHLI